MNLFPALWSQRASIPFNFNVSVTSSPVSIPHCPPFSITWYCSLLQTASSFTKKIDIWCQLTDNCIITGCDTLYTHISILSHFF